MSTSDDLPILIYQRSSNLRGPISRHVSFSVDLSETNRNSAFFGALLGLFERRHKASVTLHLGVRAGKERR